MKIISESALEKYVCTVGNNNEVDKIMRLTLIIQRVFGQHILDPKWTWKKCYLQQCITGFLLVYVVIGTYDVIKNTNDVKIVAEASYTLVISTIFPCKYILFVINKDVFRKLYVLLKTTLYNTIKNESESKIEMILKKSVKVVYGLFYMIMMPAVTYLLRVIWYYLHGERVTMSRTTSNLMPMVTPYHELGLILHSIYMFQASFTLIMVDMWFVCFMYFFCMASDIALKILEVEKRGSDESRESYAGRLNISLKTFYEVHVQQMDGFYAMPRLHNKHLYQWLVIRYVFEIFLNTMNVMFKWLYLIPLFNVMMSACIIFLLMSKGIPWSFAPNMIPCFGELFAYNWFGEQIKLKAFNLNMALLRFDWCSLTLKDKKSYYIIISYMQKEFGLKTAIGNYLSLITMSAVLKTSYQAFTVLQTLEV